MKVIAITQRLMENETYPETRECLDVRWGRLLTRLELMPIPLPTAADPAAYLTRFAPEGLLLTGGNDVSSVSTSPLSKVRDAFELCVLGIALERKLPVFAVCRGMQLLADHYGAKLEKVTGHTSGARHGLVVNRDSRFGKLLGDLASVRSYHDWGVRTVPAGFVEVARASDGVIEAMEHESLPIFCQMWHPEREDALTEGESAVIHALFEADGEEEKE